MIRKMIETLKTIRVYFLLKDCKKLIKKYYGKKADELGYEYGKDVDRLYNKYQDSRKATKIVLDTIELIESYDKEAYKKVEDDLISLIEEVKSAPDGAWNTEQGNETINQHKRPVPTAL